MDTNEAEPLNDMTDSSIQLLRFFSGPDFALRRSRWMMRAAAATPLGTYLLRKLYTPPMPELECEAFGMKFSSPVGIAAGFDTNGNMIDALAASGFGFVEVGSITPRPQNGSAARRLHRLEGDHALIYNSDIESAGVERVIDNIKRTRSNTVIVGCNIAKNHATPERDAPADFLRSFRSLYQYADYFTVNVCDNSSPEPFIPRTKEQVEAILEPLFEFRRGQNQYRPVLLKISPDLSDEQIDSLTDIMLTMPLDGLVACGGTTGRYGIENSTREIHALGRTPGIMCGAPLKARVLHIVSHISRRTKGACPVIACGGIADADDVEAMLGAGAILVQICSAYIYGGGRSLRKMQTELSERIRWDRAEAEGAERRRQQQEHRQAQSARQAALLAAENAAEATTNTAAETATEAAAEERDESTAANAGSGKTEEPTATAGAETPQN